MKLLIKVGAITNAQRALSVLRSYGYRAKITRLENPSKDDGCGYAIEVQSNNDRPVNLLTNNGIRIRGVE